MPIRRRRKSIGGSPFKGGLTTPKAVAGGVTKTKSIRFDGVDENYTASSSSFFNVTGGAPFSIEAWVKPAASDSVYISKRVLSPFAEGIAIFYFTSNFWIQMTDGDGGNLTKRTTATYTTGSWYHVVITYDGSKDQSGVIFYVNGNAVAGTTTANTFANDASNTGSFKIAADGNNSLHYNGNVAEVRLWNIELTSGQVSTLYNSGSLFDVFTAGFNATQLYDEFLMGDGASDDETQVVGTVNSTTLTGANLEAADIEEDVP